MIISDKIRKARKEYKCCECNKTIKIGDKYHRLFGAAFEDDPKYELFLCLDCNRAKKQEANA